MCCSSSSKIAADDNYDGALQKGLTPIHWGISMAQVIDVMNDERNVTETVMNITDTGSSTMRALSKTLKTLSSFVSELILQRSEMWKEMSWKRS